jgi:transposase
MRRHRHHEFIRFLNAVERAVPAGSHPRHRRQLRKWLERHPRWTFHFTPTSGSWLNAVEGFFATHTKRRLHRPSLEFKRDGVWRKSPLLKIEIGGEHYDVANCHAAWPCQHEHHHCRHFAGLQQTSGLLGLLQLLRRPIREQCADDGAG